MADARHASLILVPGARSDPVAIAGQCLRAAFPESGSDTLEGETTRLLIHLSHQPYDRQR
jgi:hypothetical protein